MRLGSNSSNDNSGRAGAAGVWPAERYHLSFSSRDSASRVGSRRRVFARLAPHTADLTEDGQAHEVRLTAEAAAEAASAAVGIMDARVEDRRAFMDGDVNADQYFDMQMMLPPTPPRRRATDSDMDMDSASDSDPGVSVSRAGAAGGIDDEAQVRRSLAQFGQLRRQRFLRDQRQWHNSTIARASFAEAHISQGRAWAQSQPSADGIFASSSSREAGLDSILLPFPSNDVDSYWYHQPEPEPAGSASFQRSSTTHPATASVQSALLGRHRNTPQRNTPQVSRNLAAEESRHAMLDVIRTHHSFALSNDESEPSASRSGSNTSLWGGDLSRGAEPNWTTLLATEEAESWRSEKPEALDNEDNEAISGLSSSEREARRRSQRARQCNARVEDRMVQWLTKNSIAVRDLSCALLRPGMRFSGIQRVTSQTREPARANSFMHLGSPPPEQWDVGVEIQTVDMQHGKVTGLMKAINVPNLPHTVVTCWGGEIVDFVNYMPLTDKWRATSSDDSRHWSMFTDVQSHPETWPAPLRGKRMPQVLEDCIFMRWKEMSFVNVRARETGLTIEGFYYVCMNRKTGAIDGVYFDPSTQPFQRLTLGVENSGRGMSFASA
ncbi:hypothetical protein IW145_001732, partial [Coemansia sp. RSA 521]